MSEERKPQVIYRDGRIITVAAGCLHCAGLLRAVDLEVDNVTGRVRLICNGCHHVAFSVERDA